MHQREAPLGSVRLGGPVLTVLFQSQMRGLGDSCGRVRSAMRAVAWFAPLCPSLWQPGVVSLTVPQWIKNKLCLLRVSELLLQCFVRLASL